MEKETTIYGVSDFYALKENSWSGAIQVLDQVEEKGVQEQVLDLLNDVIGTGITETQLNDYIWFDMERDLKEFYGINLWNYEEDEEEGEN